MIHKGILFALIAGTFRNAVHLKSCVHVILVVNDYQTLNTYSLYTYRMWYSTHLDNVSSIKF